MPRKEQNSHVERQEAPVGSFVAFTLHAFFLWRVGAKNMKLLYAIVLLSVLAQAAWGQPSRQTPDASSQTATPAARVLRTKAPVPGKHGHVGPSLSQRQTPRPGMVLSSPEPKVSDWSKVKMQFPAGSPRPATPPASQGRQDQRTSQPLTTNPTPEVRYQPRSLPTP